MYTHIYEKKDIRTRAGLEEVEVLVDQRDDVVGVRQARLREREGELEDLFGTSRLEFCVLHVRVRVCERESACVSVWWDVQHTCGWSTEEKRCNEKESRKG